jgi:hypothetical protein
MGMVLFRAPPMPVPPAQYSQQYGTQLIRVLGVYFSQLDSRTPIQSDEFIGGLFTGYGRELNLPHAMFSSTTTQSAALTTAAYAVTFNTTGYTNEITLASSSRLTATYAGIYNVGIRAQFNNTDTVARGADIWLRKGGVDVANSTTTVTVPLSGDLGASVNWDISLAAGEYAEVMWHATNTLVSLKATGTQATPTRPANPSAIAVVSFISAIP